MEIKYSKQAEKFLNAQPSHISERIRSGIRKLPDGDVVKLQGTTGYRLRIGSYRILFDRVGYIIFISRIDNRGQVYKK